MSSVGVNDILCLKIRYPDGEISTKNHYYLITEEIKGEKYVMFEVSQFDSINEKNKYLQFEDYISLVKGEVNTCINKDSYIDKRREIKIEKYGDLQKYKVNNTISIRAIKNCIKFRAEHNILDINKVSILKDEIESINGNKE